MASYRGPDSRISDFQVASALTPAPARMVLAAAAPAPKVRPKRYDIFDEATVGEPQVLVPPAATAYDDPLAPLILRTGFSSSYASTDHFSKAADAATDLASLSVVQLGVFSVADNAARAAASFRQYGRVATTDIPSGDRTMQAVRVIVDTRTVSAEDLLAAAKAAGFSDAYIVAQ
jgi:hypothetical protein